MKVADRNYVRPLGKCEFHFEINSRIQPFEFTVLPNCIYDIILVWVFLEVSQAIIHRDKSELAFEDLPCDTSNPQFWTLYAADDCGYYPIYCQNICHQSLKGIKISVISLKRDQNICHQSQKGSKYLSSVSKRI
ncbi:hypothetical protein CDAR_118511 [Caerostris darwini]|uniref:Uncharacterized protein n=1 Tax=Caerostris darwini TaxID=1538125 RepID=A0AAV4X0U8_9ARAC|nr:hypothetical protein CDAR_118511 [Caerostris darwini]